MGGSWSSRPIVVSCVGQSGSAQLGPGVKHVGGPVEGEPEDARVDLRHREQPNLEPRHGAEVAAAPAQAPKELRVCVLVGAHQRAVCGDDVRRDDGVCSQTELAPEEAEPSAQCVADGADVGGRAGERCQPVPRGRLDDLGPMRPRLHAGDTGVHVDLHAPKSVGANQQRAVERAHGRGAVPGPLDGDPQAVLACVVHSFDDGARRVGNDDRRRPLVDRKVPSAPRLVPLRRPRMDDTQTFIGSQARHLRPLRRGLLERA